MKFCHDHHGARISNEGFPIAYIVTKKQSFNCSLKLRNLSCVKDFAVWLAWHILSMSFWARGVRLYSAHGNHNYSIPFVEHERRRKFENSTSIIIDHCSGSVVVGIFQRPERRVGDLEGALREVAPTCLALTACPPRGECSIAEVGGDSTAGSSRDAAQMLFALITKASFFNHNGIINCYLIIALVWSWHMNYVHIYWSFQ